jgi:hypothetical protein
MAGLLDGRALAKLQEEEGLRPIVEDVNSLRIYFGSSAVSVLTPIVETKLRSGTHAARCLSLSVEVERGPDDRFIFAITYPKGFPASSLEIGVTHNGTSHEEYQRRIDEARDAKDNAGEYVRGVDIIRNFLNQYDADASEATADSSAAAVNVCGDLDVDVDAEVKEDADAGGAIDNTYYFTCRVCRMPLFEQEELHEHSAKQLEGQGQGCSSLFLQEPHRGMDAAAAAGTIITPSPAPFVLAFG